MSKETGGPAFPTNTRIGTNKDGTWIAETPAGDGMTLRDYFAAKAMQGYISGVLSDVGMSTKTLQAADRKGLKSEEYFASMSYTVADAMLKVRGQ